jgi:hypothetical protein
MGVFLRLIVLTLVVLTISAERGSAVEFLRRGRTQAEKSAHFIGSPPGSQMYPEKVGVTYPPYGPMQAVPTYDWGFFGARSKTSHWNQSEYFGDNHSISVPRSF